MLHHELARTIHAEREREVAARLKEAGLRGDRVPESRRGGVRQRLAALRGQQIVLPAGCASVFLRQALAS